MKKCYQLFIIFLIGFFLNAQVIYATTFDAYVAGDTVYIRSMPSTAGTKLATLNTSDSLTLDDLTLYPDESTNNACPAKWYKVTYNDETSSITGYMCSTYVVVTTSSENLPDNVEPRNDYEVTLKNLGFPSSYWPGLTLLHNNHPNWIFNAQVLTKVNWYAALSAQSIDGKSLTSGNVGYRDTGAESYNFLTDTFVAKELTRYNASDDYIAYYMDPRNWLNETYIFQFEDLSYHPSYQTLGVVQSIFTTSSNPNSDLKSYSPDYITAATQTINGVSTSISPVHLASRSRQEVGLSNGKTQINGTSPSYYRGFSVYGYYNFYNIGAYADSYTTNPVARGLAFASGEKCSGCGFTNDYGRPWTSGSLAVIGGANNIIRNYYLNGQDTIYYERFNIHTSGTLFTHQYMTQVESPSSESAITYNAYSDNNKLGEAIVFNIPVYTGMPSTISVKPNTGNPNNHLKDLTVNGQTVTNFTHDTYSYDVIVATGATSINVSGSVINSNAKINGIGNVDITNNKTVNIDVTAENGSVKRYILNIKTSDMVVLKPSEILSNSGIKNDGTIIHTISVGTNSNDIVTLFTNVAANATILVKEVSRNQKTNNNLVTGDIVSIASGSETKEYPISVVGDINGDGVVTIADLLKVQKNILGVSSLSSVYLKSADVNNDGNVNLLDLLKVQKYILGISKF